MVKHDDWDWSDPWALLRVPSLPLSGSRPLLAVSGSSGGWPARCRQVTPGKLGCGLPLRGAQGTGQSVRASVLLSRLLTEAGVTPAVHLRTRVWCGWCRGCQTVKKTECFFFDFAVLRGWADSRQWTHRLPPKWSATQSHKPHTQKSGNAVALTHSGNSHRLKQILMPAHPPRGGGGPLL